VSIRAAAPAPDKDTPANTPAKQNEMLLKSAGSAAQAATQLQTATVHLGAAQKNLDEGKYLAAANYAVSAMGNFSSSLGSALTAAVGFAEASGNKQLSSYMKTAASYFNAAGTPLNHIGKTLRAFDSALKSFNDPGKTTEEKDLAFLNAVSTAAAGLGSAVNTLNAAPGSSNKFAAAFGNALAAAGVLGQGIGNFQQGGSAFGPALEKGDWRAAAAAGAGAAYGGFQVMAGLGQATGQALESVGYKELAGSVAQQARYLLNVASVFSNLRTTLNSFPSPSRRRSGAAVPCSTSSRKRGV
jgi:hypothetical protein